ncbi:MAG TPA: SDR family NAD(P)-dependent oxidoreductase [Chthoniobacterales bacterium]|nr:SDR family NAD(P)-dependent oxidoreductase [Chthoniobacterales bacterium]
MAGTRLKGVHALVTGSSSGIGAAIALRVAREGANVAVHYRGHPERATAVLEQVEATGAGGFLVHGDMAKLDEVQRMIAQTIEHFGSLELLVNNAGIEKNQPFLEVTPDDFDRVLE